MTIDQVYSMIVRSSRDMSDDKKREAFLQEAREHYYQRDQAKLQKMLGALPLMTPGLSRAGALGEGLYASQGRGLYAATTGGSVQQSRRKFMEADGMPDPSIYNYFSDFDSPLKQKTPALTKSYPLYNQFGAYN